MTCHIMCRIMRDVANKSHLETVAKVVGKKRLMAWRDEGLKAPALAKEIAKSGLKFDPETVRRWIVTIDQWRGERDAQGN